MRGILWPRNGLLFRKPWARSSRLPSWTFLWCQQSPFSQLPWTSSSVDGSWLSLPSARWCCHPWRAPRLDYVHVIRASRWCSGYAFKVHHLLGLDPKQGKELASSCAVIDSFFFLKLRYNWHRTILVSGVQHNDLIFVYAAKWPPQ